MTARQVLSRSLSRRFTAANGQVGARHYAKAALAVTEGPSVPNSEAGPSRFVPKGRSPFFPQKPVKEKPRERVSYQQGGNVASPERTAYFACGEDKEVDTSVWDGAEIGDSIPGLEPGRVVECRRSGSAMIGLILGSVMANGRQRLIVLRQTGDIWPVSLNDVQFAMPSSLIPAGLAARCWSTDLMEAWARGEEAGGDEELHADLMAATREVAVILRKVARETERMDARLSGPGRSGKGGAEAVWEEWVSNLDEDARGQITPAAAAEFVLRAQAPAKAAPVHIRDNTLPAYAAHCMLMRRADLFVADEGQMWQHGVFMVRSKAERARIQRLEAITYETDDNGADRAALASFINKTRAVLAQKFTGDRPPPVDWTETDRMLLHGLAMREYETRSTQYSPYDLISVSLLRAMDPYPGEIADQSMIAKLLTDLGCWPAEDTLSTSKSIEGERRSMTLAGLSTSATSREGLYEGNELDSLREDFSSQRVWVIDDPGAVELDDGISVSRVEGSDDVWVHVHIADPTRKLPLDHALAEQASFRGSALYLPEGNTPLFPLAEVMESIHLGTTDGRTGGQGVVVFSALLDSAGDIKDSKVQMGWIKNPRVTTYAAVDRALGIEAEPRSRPFGSVAASTESSHERGAPIDVADMDDLETLRRIALLRRAKRVQNGSVDWSIPTASLSLINRSTPYHDIFDLSTFPAQTHPFAPAPLIDYVVSTPPPSRPITAATTVAEVMMLAGRVAAIHCEAHGLPVPYRAADRARQLLIPGWPEATLSVDDLLAQRTPDGAIDPYLTWRSGVVFPPTTVTTTPQDHWTMGFVGSDRGYVRATSPLRRFDDLLTHWQIKTHLARSRGLSWGKTFKEDEVAILNRRVEDAQRRAKRAGIAARDYWQARLIGQKLVEPYSGEEGTVDLREPLVARVARAPTARAGVQSTRVIIPALNAMVAMSGPVKALEIGDEVSVRVIRVTQWPSPIIEAVPA